MYVSGYKGVYVGGVCDCVDGYLCLCFSVLGVGICVYVCECVCVGVHLCECYCV